MEEREPRDATTVVLDRMEGEVKDILRALEGDQFSGQEGLLTRLKRVEDDLSDIKQSKVIAQAERAGQKKLLNVIGVTSILGVIGTILTLATLLLTLQGAF